MYLHWKFLKWSLTSKITSYLTFSQQLVLSQFNRVLQLVFPTAQKNQGRRPVNLEYMVAEIKLSNLLDHLLIAVASFLQIHVFAMCSLNAAKAPEVFE